METLTIRLQKKVKEKLNTAAFNEGMTASQYVRRMIIKVLKLKLKDIDE